MATPTAEEIRKMTPAEQSALLSSGAETLKGLAPLVQANEIGTASTLKYPPTPTDTSTANVMAGITSNLPDTTPKPEMSEAEKRLAELTGTETQSRDLINQATQALTNLQTRGTAEAELRASKGTQQIEQDIQNLSNQINAIQTATTTSKLALQEQGRGIPQAILSGQASRIERDNAIQALTLSAQLQAKQGNLQLAETQIKNALDLKYAPEIAKIEMAKAFLELNSDALSEAQKLRADKVTRELNFDKDIIDSIRKYAEQAAINGADAKVVMEIANAKTIPEALNKAGNYLGTSTGITAEYNTYVRDQKARGLTALSFDDYQTQDANRKVALAKATAGFSGLTTQQNTVIGTVASSFENSPIVKDFNIIQGKYQNTLANIGQGNGANDIALIYDFMKALDPTSVVRESEYNTGAYKTGNIFSGALAKFNGLLDPKGGFVSEAAKQNIINVMKSRFESARTQYNNFRNEKLNQVKNRAGVDNPELYITDYDYNVTAPQATPASSYIDSLEKTPTNDTGTMITNWINSLF